MIIDILELAAVLEWLACRRTLSIWTLIAERMGGTSARALSGQKETREG